jgi:hypothetical protein
MQRAMEAIDATEDDEDGGSEKNLPTG